MPTVSIDVAPGARVNLTTVAPLAAGSRYTLEASGGPVTLYEVAGASAVVADAAELPDSGHVVWPGTYHRAPDVRTVTGAAGVYVYAVGADKAARVTVTPAS